MLNNHLIESATLFATRETNPNIPRLALDGAVQLELDMTSTEPNETQVPDEPTQ